MLKSKMSEINIPNSSNLKSASYDEATKIMIVNFQNGTSYRYANVPEELWSRFETTVNENGSAGKFFHANIRNLPCEKVEE